VSIIGDKCIPNYPDRNLPSFFIYRNGEIVSQQVAWGADKERIIEELEALLILTGAVIPPDRPTPSGRRDHDQDEDDSDELLVGMNSGTATNGRAPKKNIRGSSTARKDDDDDSDFDM